MLPPETARVWDFLKTQTALAGFILIGGSALALRLGHRRSEDLDLACPEPRLPLRRLEALLDVTDEMAAWKTDGTRLYQSLPKRLHDTLKPCEPLREVPSDRVAQHASYRTWHETRES